MKKNSLLSAVLAGALCLTLAVSATAAERPEPVHPTGGLTLPEGTGICLGAAEGEERATLLEADPQGAIQAILQGLEERAERIDIWEYAIPVARIRELMDHIRSRYPQTFGTAGYTWYYEREDGDVASVEFDYTLPAGEYEAAWAFCEEELERIAALVDPAWSREKQVLFLHDYLTTHYEYDQTLEIYDIYTMLKTGEGVCQGYTLLMEGLLDKLGIPVSYVRSDNANHIWNMVQMEDGSWYHLDATWDDPTNSPLGVSHSYLLVSDALMTDHIADVGGMDWVYGAQALDGTAGESPCTDGTYDEYFWRDACSPFAAVDGEFYFVGAQTLNRWDEEGPVALEGTKPESWTRYSQSGLDYYGGKLYYNTPNQLVCYSLYTGETRILEEVELDIDVEMLSGCVVRETPEGNVNVDYERYSFNTERGAVYTLLGIDPYHRSSEGGYGCCPTAKGLRVAAPETGFLIAARYAEDGRLLEAKVYENGAEGALDPGAAEERVKLMGGGEDWRPDEPLAELPGDFNVPKVTAPGTTDPGEQEIL